MTPRRASSGRLGRIQQRIAWHGAERSPPRSRSPRRDGFREVAAVGSCVGTVLILVQISLHLLVLCASASCTKAPLTRPSPFGGPSALGYLASRFRPLAVARWWQKHPSMWADQSTWLLASHRIACCLPFRGAPLCLCAPSEQQNNAGERRLARVLAADG